VLDSCRQLQREGFEVTYLPVRKDGILDLKVRIRTLHSLGLVRIVHVSALANTGTMYLRVCV